MQKRLMTIIAAVMTSLAIGVAGAPVAGALPSTAAGARAGTSPPIHVRQACNAVPAAGRAECLTLLRTAADGKPLTSGTDPSTLPYGYGPKQLTAAYELAAAAKSRGAGQTVALVDAFDDPNAEADLATYRAEYGLPPCTTANGCFRKVDQDGQASPLPSPDPGWAVEESLDIEMVSAICPKCHIILAEANDNEDYNLAATVAMAAKLGATEISNSYGGPEYAAETRLEPFFDQPGVQVTAAAGDGGYGVSYPAASAYVTSVGGTSLWPDSSSRGWTEKAWPGTGSGCSTVIAKPSWQHDQCARRSDNDVAAVADPDTAVAIYDSFDNGGWLQSGGTSVASPIIAAVYALLGDPKAPAGSYFYAHRSHLFDVTAGRDGTCSPAYQCTAGRGYDMPTGLGTPDFTGASSTGGGSCVNGWSATPRQAYPSLDQALFFPTTAAINTGVAALSARDVWTAGFYDATDNSGPASSVGLVSNIERWNGSRWSRVPSPTTVIPGGFSDSAVPVGISFDRPSDGWVAGFDQGMPTAAHWNGSRWSLTPVLSQPGTFQTQGIELANETLPFGIAAISPDDVWLTGMISDSNSPFLLEPVGSFMEHWNGRTWSMITIPDPQHLALRAITAISANDVWAVGQSIESSGISDPVMLHWDGHSWSSAVSPPVTSPDAQLNAVSGSGPDDIWAVGREVDESAGKFIALTEHWNGQAWSVVSPQQPPAALTLTELDGVAAISPSNVWAAGTWSGIREGMREARLYLLEHWDGTKWSIVATPQTPVPDGLRAISANSAANVWIAGSQQIPAGPPAWFADDPWNLHRGCGND